jgi:hypothetical protein
MKKTLAQDTLLLGLLTGLQSGSTEHELTNIYQQATPADAETIHDAIVGLLGDLQAFGFSSKSIQFRRLEKLLVRLANIPVPGLNNQSPISDGLDEIRSTIKSLEEAYPGWVEMLENVDPGSYVNNGHACDVLIKNMPGNNAKIRKQAFLRQLTDCFSASHFITELSDRYGLEQPYFPYDWAKNTYYLMGFHLLDPGQDVLNIRDVLWETLFSLSNSER